MIGPVGLAVLFAIQIGLMAAVAGRVPAVSLVLAAALGSTVAATAWTLQRPRGSRVLGRRDLLTAALAGAAMLFLAPYLVLTHRYTDAPPGTELIFFACVGWGALAVLSGIVGLVRSGRRRGAAAAAIGAIAAVTGAAGILGNWERPSSFSPLVRFASEEAWMLAAGAVFIAGAVLLASVLRGRPSRWVMPIASAAALACAVAVAAIAPGGLTSALQLGDFASTVLYWAVSWAVSTMVFVGLVVEDRVVAAGASLMVAPALLSLLSWVETATGVAGPQPFVWPGVVGGTLLIVAGIARMARAGAADDGRPAWTWMRWAASALAAAGLVGMFLPALAAHVSANRPAGAMEFTWTLPGWEAVGGWAALSCALLLLAATFDDAPLPAFGALAAPVAAWALATTPYHVLTRWLSSDIQVDFGTEYAAITFRALTVWPSVVAVVGAVAGLVVVLSGRFVRRDASAVVPEPTRTEES